MKRKAVLKEISSLLFTQYLNAVGLQARIQGGGKGALPPPPLDKKKTNKKPSQIWICVTK